MKHFILFLERVLYPLAINSRGFINNLMCRAWGNVFGLCYLNGWLDD